MSHQRTVRVCIVFALVGCAATSRDFSTDADAGERTNDAGSPIDATHGRVSASADANLDADRRERSWEVEGGTSTADADESSMGTGDASSSPGPLASDAALASADSGMENGAGGGCSGTVCGRECVDLKANPDHCGMCGRRCEMEGVETRKCEDGRCTSTCRAGLGNCYHPVAGDPDDGCETNLTTDTNHCRACERKCLAGGGVQEVKCSGNRCISTCQVGYANIDKPEPPSADDGCEVEFAVDPNHCGALNRTCSSTNVSIRTCAGGLCTSSCGAGYWNVNRPTAPTADDGCEALCPATTGGPAMVRLPEGYCIDSTEVTRAQYQAWLSSAPSTTGQVSHCGWNTSFTPDATGRDPVRASIDRSIGFN